MQLSSEVLLLAVAALMLAQSIASMRAAQRLLILGSLLSDMVKSTSKDEVGNSANISGDDGDRIDRP